MSPTGVKRHGFYGGLGTQHDPLECVRTLSNPQAAHLAPAAPRKVPSLSKLNKLIIRRMRSGVNLFLDSAKRIRRVRSFASFSSIDTSSDTTVATTSSSVTSNADVWRVVLPLVVPFLEQIDVLTIRQTCRSFEEAVASSFFSTFTIRPAIDFSASRPNEPSSLLDVFLAKVHFQHALDLFTSPRIAPHVRVLRILGHPDVQSNADMVKLAFMSLRNLPNVQRLECAHVEITDLMVREISNQAGRTKRVWDGIMIDGCRPAFDDVFVRVAVKEIVFGPTSCVKDDDISAWIRVLDGEILRSVCVSSRTGHRLSRPPTLLSGWGSLPCT